MTVAPFVWLANYSDGGPASNAPDVGRCAEWLAVKAHAVRDLLRGDICRDPIAATAAVIELAPLATDIAATLVGGLPSERLRSATEPLAAADVIVLGTPVYKAGLSGLFKSFVDVLDDDLVVGEVWRCWPQ